tara:strand:- start:39 stop:830 length:792 start_codon:yes stop_codon:yes gene_type:complete
MVSTTLYEISELELFIFILDYSSLDSIFKLGCCCRAIQNKHLALNVSTTPSRISKLEHIKVLPLHLYPKFICDIGKDIFCKQIKSIVLKNKIEEDYQWLNHNTELYIGYSHIINRDIPYLVTPFFNNTTIRIIDFTFNFVGDKGAIILASILRQNTTLLYLGLQENQIGNIGVFELAQSLEENSTLKELDLRLNKVGNRGACYLGEMLKRNTTLTKLNLGWNDIGDEGGKFLIHILRRNTIKCVLEENRFSDSVKIELIELNL